MRERRVDRSERWPVQKPESEIATNRQLGLLCPIQTVNRMGQIESFVLDSFSGRRRRITHRRSYNRVMPRMPNPCPYCKGQTRAVLKIVRSNPKAKGRKVWFCA